MFFIEAFWRFKSLFISLRVFSESSKTCYFRSLYIIVGDNCSFTKNVSQLGSNMSNVRSKNFKASLTSSTRCLFFDKAGYFNQLEHALSENFIMNIWFELAMNI